MVPLQEVGAVEQLQEEAQQQQGHLGLLPAPMVATAAAVGVVEVVLVSWQLT
jgi:hypothetical protein